MIENAKLVWSKYQLTIAHRVCPALSKTVVGFSDKRALVEATTKTMAAALASLRVRLIVILDGCSDYRAIFETAFHNRIGDPSFALEIVETPSIGNKATWAKQIEILADADTDIVYFSEDDYLYAPNAFQAMMDAIDRLDVDLVSPLDHPDRYNKRFEDPHPESVRVTEHGHWRTADSTCLTFMARRKVLEISKDVMLSYSRTGEEGTMWCGLTQYRLFDLPHLVWTAIKFVLRIETRFGCILPLCTWKQQGLKMFFRPRYTLVSPIPTLAVHLSSASLPVGAECFFPEAQQKEILEVAFRYAVEEVAK